MIVKSQDKGQFLAQPNIWARIVLLTILCHYYSDTFSQTNFLSIGDTLLASQFYTKGLDYVDQRKYDSAVYTFQKSSALYQKANAWDRFFFSQLQVGDNLNRQWKFKESTHYLDSIEVNFIDKMDSSFNSYQKFYIVMAWSYFNLLDYDKALRYFEIIHSATNASVGSKIYANYYKGVIYQRIGQYDMALKLMLKTKELCIKDSTRNFLGEAYNNLGIIYRNLGEYERAIEFYKKAILIGKQTYQEVDLTPIYNNIGTIYRYLGQYDEALKELNYAIDVLTSYTKDYYLVESALVNSKVEVLLEIGDFEQAKILLENVQKRELNNHGKNELIQTGTILSFGKLYAKMGLLDKSNSYFDQHNEIMQNFLGAKNDKSIEAIKLKGLNQVSSKKYQEAAETFQQGIISLVTEFNELDFNENPSLNSDILDRVELVEVLFHKSNALLQLYAINKQEKYLLAAAKANSTATQLLEQVRVNMLYKMSKIKLSEKAKSIYEQSIKIALLLNTKEDSSAAVSVFEAMENSRSYLLSEARLRANSLGYSSQPDSLSKIENDYYTSIKILERELLSASINKLDSAEIKMIKEQLFTTKESFEAYQQSDAGSANRNNRLAVPSIAEVQSKLAKRDLIVEYFVGDSVLYAIAISERKVRLFELDLDKMALITLTKNLTQNSQLQAQEFQLISNNVYKTILEPILSDFNGTKRIIVVPDNQLGYLSFDALITALTDAPTYSKLNYLINKYTILQHQSVGLYINQEPGGANVNNQYIGFAPDFSQDQLSRVEGRPLRSDLQPLPFAKKEIEVISSLLGGEIETGLKASESNFKLKSSNYNILHIASHAVIDEENPLYSMLVFAGGDSIENEDGNLYTFEIYGMNLNCDLVTLSACNTGNGKYFEGEGIFSLGRAFLLAGSKSVLTSYWEVSDQSTSAIMESFYRNLIKGNNKPEALRQAKLEYLKNADALTANPYYWAGFVYMGTPDVVYGSNKMYYWLVGGFLVLILVLFGIRRTFSSKV